MFEKEAEEYAEENKEVDWEGFDKNKKDLEKAFKDGAEFGFQQGIKAKVNTTTISDCPIKDEWHRVDEGKYPTEEKDYLVKLTDGTIDVMTVALDGDLEPYLLTPKFDFYKDVEKWCEIPKE